MAARTCSLKEEHWHAFQRTKAAGFCGKPTRFSVQCGQTVVQNMKRAYESAGGRDLGKPPPHVVRLHGRALSSDHKVYSRPRKLGNPALRYAASKLTKADYKRPKAELSELRSKLLKEYSTLDAAEKAPFEQAEKETIERKRLARALQTASGGLPDGFVTPWELGDDSWPLQPPFLDEALGSFGEKERGLELLLSSGRDPVDVQHVAERYRPKQAFVGFVDSELKHVVDEFQSATDETWQRVSKQRPLTLSCGEKHFGLCVKRDAKMLLRHKAMQKLLGKIPKGVPLDRRWSSLIVFYSELEDGRKIAAACLQVAGLLKPAIQAYVPLITQDPEIRPILGRFVYAPATLKMPIRYKLLLDDKTSDGEQIACMTTHELVTYLLGLSPSAWSVKEASYESTSLVDLSLTKVIKFHGKVVDSGIPVADSASAAAAASDPSCAAAAPAASPDTDLGSASAAASSSATAVAAAPARRRMTGKRADPERIEFLEIDEDVGSGSDASGGSHDADETFDGEDGERDETEFLNIVEQLLCTKLSMFDEDLPSLAHKLSTSFVPSNMPYSFEPKQKITRLPYARDSASGEVPPAPLHLPRLEEVPALAEGVPEGIRKPRGVATPVDILEEHMRRRGRWAFVLAHSIVAIVQS